MVHGQTIANAELIGLYWRRRENEVSRNVARVLRNQSSSIRVAALLPNHGTLIYVVKEVFKYIFRYRVPLRLVPVRKRRRQIRNRLHSEHPGSPPRCRSRANIAKQDAQRWRDQGVLHVRYDIRVESAWRKAYYFSRLQCHLNETVAASFSKY